MEAREDVADECVASCSAPVADRSAVEPSFSSSALLQTSELRVELRSGNQLVRLVDGVSYQLPAGRTLAIIGESGAGKSVSCRALIGLQPPGSIVSGSVRFNGAELVGLSETNMRRHRGADIAMVFQDADNALNPTMRVGHQITEVIRRHDRVGVRAARDRAVELLRQLRMSAPEHRFYAYPHELSGGMRQRVMLAIALAGNPRVLVADEMTRTLDVTTQAQIMQLLTDLQRARGLAVIMISHDLALAANFADYIVVMYAGRVIERGPTGKLFAHARTPYTKALLDSRLRVDTARAIPAVQGHPPDLAQLSTTTCAFEPRCSRAGPLCASQRPPLLEQEPGHYWACWHPCRDGDERT